MPSCSTGITDALAVHQTLMQASNRMGRLNSRPTSLVNLGTWETTLTYTSLLQALFPLLLVAVVIPEKVESQVSSGHSPQTDRIRHTLQATPFNHRRWEASRALNFDANEHLNWWRLHSLWCSEQWRWQRWIKLRYACSITWRTRI